MSDISQETIACFAKDNNLSALSIPSLVSIINKSPGYNIPSANKFIRFQHRINKELLKHHIITDNNYTAWFSKGDISAFQVKTFVVQFSVFSNLFLIAQLHKMINADTVDNMRASKEILANEIGVSFKPGRPQTSPLKTDQQVDDPELATTQGSIEGGTFRFSAAHFEWLLRLAEKMDLHFSDIGKRQHGTDSTLFFCDELVRLYGSTDYLTSQAASYAVENWAAAGFWEQLIRGFETYNQRTNANLPISFFTWHNRLEAQHALHTQEELEDIYFSQPIDEDRFIEIGNEMLDGVATFWEGLSRH